MLVVSNTSPISNLAIIDSLSLLKGRYGSILIPSAVAHELEALTHVQGRNSIQAALDEGWIEIRETDSLATDIFKSQVDPGEAEAIALAQMIGAEKVWIDDRLGRELARSQGLPVTGLLGELMHANLHGQIPSVAQVIDRLQKEARFFIREDLKRLILAEMDE